MPLWIQSLVIGPGQRAIQVVRVEQLLAVVPEPSYHMIGSSSQDIPPGVTLCRTRQFAQELCCPDTSRTRPATLRGASAGSLPAGHMVKLPSRRVCWYGKRPRAANLVGRDLAPRAGQQFQPRRGLAAAARLTVVRLAAAHDITPDGGLAPSEPGLLLELLNFNLFPQRSTRPAAI